MVALIPYKPLYQALMVISLAAGVWGIPVIFSFVRGGPAVYRNALLVLVIGAVSAGIQMGVSQAVRGSCAPVNMRFYLTIFTLAVFLLFRLPPIWARLGLTTKDEKSHKAAGGTALIVCGLVVVATRWWVGASHLSAWVEILAVPLGVWGWGMVIVGVGVLLAAASGIFKYLLISRQN